MRLGILSDTHGRAAAAREAAGVLLDRGAGVLIHLGDVGSVDVLRALAVAAARHGSGVPVHVVFGNVDDVRGLSGEAARLGLQVDHPAGTLTADGKTVAFQHGDDPSLLRSALAAAPHFLLHGHTHRIRDEMAGATRIINPGALHRAARHTVALLDLADGRLDIVELGK